MFSVLPDVSTFLPKSMQFGVNSHCLCCSVRSDTLKQVDSERYFKPAQKMRAREVAVNQLQIGPVAHLWEYNMCSIAVPRYYTDCTRSEIQLAPFQWPSEISCELYIRLHVAYRVWFLNTQATQLYIHFLICCVLFTRQALKEMNCFACSYCLMSGCEPL